MDRDDVRLASAGLFHQVAQFGFGFSDRDGFLYSPKWSTSFQFDEPLRFDVLIEACLLLELKCVQEILPIHKAQLLSYMRLLNIPLGLIINFHELKLVDGLVRMILPGANR